MPVVVVGSVNVDCVVRAERLPAPGETVSGGTFARYGGGKGANQAIAAARAGCATRLVAAVGDDADGVAALSELAAAGVDTRHVAHCDDAATGVALIVVDAAGRNQIAVAPGANARLAAFPRDALADGPGVALLSFEAPDGVLCAAAEAAAAAGWRVIVNPAPWRPLPARLAACHPVLVPNEHEASALAGIADPVAAAEALARDLDASVIVTLGAAGAALVVDGAVARVPAPTVDVVDTTGAGDALCGTLAARLALGDALEPALVAAVAAASASTARPGAR